jgi:glycosyltransferase involved in cell wall biosynthesis
MRIVFLSVSAEIGGSETVLLELVRGLRRLRPESRLLVVVPREGALSARAEALGAVTRMLPIPAAILKIGESSDAAALSRGVRLASAAAAAHRYTRQLRTLLEEEEPDVVHSNGLKTHLLSARSCPAGAALVWHMHEYLTTRALTRTLLRRHTKPVSLLVANSRSVAADVSRALGPRISVRTVYNAVDLQAFRPAGDVADLDALAGVPSAPHGTVRVGLVATFGRWKGHEVFMRAVQRLGPASPVRAYIVGGPVYDTVGSQYSLDELRRTANQLQVGDRVAFVGVVANIPPVLRALDIVVHASTLPEPFGLVIAEAMACGRAVVASAAGGATEIVRAGEDALVHEPGDVDGLAAALSRLANDAALRGRLGRTARATAEERFDAGRFAQTFDSIYQSLVSKPLVHQ